MSPWIARALRVMVAATLAAATILAVGTFGAGERVAALDAWQINLRAELTGAGVAPGPGDPDGIGSAYVGVTPGSANLQFTLSAQGIEGQIAGPSTHLHAGAAGEVGPIVATLGSPSPDGTEFDGSLSLDGELLQDIADNPNNYYIDIHTPAFPDGALRGQLEPGPVNLSTWLLGASEVPGPGDPGMSGYAFVNVDPALQSVCWGLSYDFAGLVDPTSAAIHQAPAGSAGPAVVSLPPPVPPGTGSVCSDELDPATLQAVADDPGAYYLEISTAAYPAGAARGQLQHGYAQAPPDACAPLEICRGVLEPGTYTFTGFNTDLMFTTSIEFVAEPVIVEASEDDIAYYGEQLFGPAVGLRDPADGGELNLFRFIGEVYDDPCNPELPGQIDDSPEALIAWLSERPFLTVTDPVAVTYGGAPGLQVDIVVATRPCLSDWSFILPFNPGINGGNGSQLTGTELRLIAQTVGDETIVALTEDLTGLELSGMQSDTGVASLPLATGQPDEPGLLAAPVQGAGTSFVDVAQEVVETFEWELTSAPPQLPNTAVPADGLSRSRGLRPSDAAAVVFGAVLIVLVGLQKASCGANAPQKDQPITPMTR